MSERFNLERISKQKQEAFVNRRVSFSKSLSGEDVALIAEIKRKSPSKGEIRDVDPVAAAKVYESGGVSAISVLTDEGYFGGSILELRKVKESVSLPVLRKDFIVDPRQICESNVVGADAILLIATLLKQKTGEFVDLAHQHGLECLVEVHDEEDLIYALNSGAKVIGVNNRNLKTLEVNLSNFEELAPSIPDDRILVAESGIRTREDLERMRNAGADAVLVGSSLMESDNLPEKILELIG